MIYKPQSEPKRETIAFSISPPPLDLSPSESRQKFGGMLNRKERWGLSLKGKATIAVIALLTALLIFFYIQPFLAVTHRVDSKTLVVEGWIHEYAIVAAVKEFKAGSYERVFTTGGPIEGQGGYINDFHTDASIGADLLKKDGIPGKFVQMVPSRVWDRNRTYYSAVALRDWFQEHNLQVNSINVLTEEAHARRTWLLFQEAFGKSVKVGIISVPNPDYNAKYWWRYSDGVRDIISESVAYIYAKFFFYPPASERSGGAAP
jgi:DUF218 domain